MVVIQEKMGWLKTARLLPDQSQMFLTTLTGIRKDFTETERQKGLPGRMGQAHGNYALGEEINKRLPGLQELKKQGMQTDCLTPKGN